MLYIIGSLCPITILELKLNLQSMWLVQSKQQGEIGYQIASSAANILGCAKGCIYVFLEQNSIANNKNIHLDAILQRNPAVILLHSTALGICRSVQMSHPT